MLQVNLVVGRPASGKTTFVKKYAKETDYIIDDIMNCNDIEYYISRSLNMGKQVLWLVYANYPYDIPQFNFMVEKCVENYPIDLKVMHIDNEHNGIIYYEEHKN